MWFTEHVRECFQFFKEKRKSRSALCSVVKYCCKFRTWFFGRKKNYFSIQFLNLIKTAESNGISFKCRPELISGFLKLFWKFPTSFGESVGSPCPHCVEFYSKGIQVNEWEIRLTFIIMRDHIDLFIGHYCVIRSRICLFSVFGAAMCDCVFIGQSNVT